jgi:hypothetical protein
MMARMAKPNLAKIVGVKKWFLMLDATLQCKMKVKSNIQSET